LDELQVSKPKQGSENLKEGGVTPLGGGKKRVKLKKWRGINEKK
jgi:hypothetical protein